MIWKVGRRDLISRAALAGLLGDIESKASSLHFESAAIRVNSITELRERLIEISCQSEPYPHSISKKFILDLGGNSFRLHKPLSVPPLRGLTIQNGALEASENFEPGAPLLIFACGSSEKHVYFEDIRLVNLRFNCGWLASGISLDRYLRVIVDSCAFSNFCDYGLITQSCFGHELIVDKCTFGEFNSGQGSWKTARRAIGLVLRSPDNLVCNSIFFVNYMGIYVYGVANTFTGCHIYQGGAEKAGHVGLKVENAPYINLVGCYFDNCSVEVERPWCISIVANKFLANERAAKKLDSFVELVPTKPSQDVRGLRITENLFVNSAGSGRTMEAISIRSTNQHYFDSEKIFSTSVADNSCGNSVHMRSSKLRGTKKIVGQRCKLDFSGKGLFGGVAFFRSSVILDDYAIYRFSKELYGKKNVVEFIADRETIGTVFVEIDESAD